MNVPAQISSSLQPSMTSYKWNTPLQIPLDPAQKTVVGRLPAASSKGDKHCVILHSEKLPYMLSRQHASLTFDKKQNEWLVKDLKVSQKCHKWHWQVSNLAS